jgi:uncharacterized protein
MMRIVVDTNVIVSALVFGGAPRQVLDLAAQKLCDLYFSPQIQAEAERVLEQKFGWNRKEVDARVKALFAWGIQVRPKMTLTIIKNDPDDDRILECAIEANAHTIISGDHHLLDIGSFQGISIQTPRQFLAAKSWLETN